MLSLNHSGRKRPMVIAVAVAAMLGSGQVAPATNFTWTNNGGSGGLLWAPATNWSPAGGPPGAGDVAIFNNAPASNASMIDLGGVARTVDTLRMNETSTLAGHGFSNGSFVLRRFEHNGNRVRFWNTPVAGMSTPTGTTLTLAGTGGGFIDWTGVITTGDLNIDSDAAISLYGNNNITGTITLASHINVHNSAKPLGGGTRPMVFNTGGSLQFSAPTGTHAGGVTVNGNATFNVSRSSTTQPAVAASSVIIVAPPPEPAVLDFGPLTINGSTLAQNSLTQDAVLSFGPTTFTGSPTFTGPGLMSLGAIEGGGFALTKRGAGELTLREANNYSGGTTITDGMLTAMSPTSALGSGPVTLSGSGKLRLAAAQTTFPTVTVAAGAALGGDLTGAVYSGAEKNVTLATDAILFPTAGPTPVRGVDVAWAQYWLATSSPTGSYVVGDGGTSPFKGAMIGYINPSEKFEGTISEAEPGIGLAIRYYADYGMQATLNTTNTTTGVTFSGPQPAPFTDPIGGTATLFTVPGDATNQSKFVAVVSNSSIAADETVNVSHGVVSYSGNIAGTININNGATLSLSGSASSGTFNIHDSGIVRPSSGTPKAGSTFDYRPGAQVLFDVSVSTGASADETWLPAANVDLVLVTSAIRRLSFPGAGLMIGDERRLFADAFVQSGAPRRIVVGPDEFFPQPGAGIWAAPGADRVTIAAATGAELVVLDPITMRDVELQTNDTATFTTARFNNRVDLQRVPRNQQGSIMLVGDVTTGALTHAAGSLTFGDGTSDASYTLGALSVEGGVARLESGKLIARSVAVAAGAALDLTNERMVITEQDLGSSDGAGNYDGVQGLVQAGYNGRTWNGTGGIITSMPAAADGLTTIAAATAVQIYGGGGTFGGVSVEADDVLLKYTYAGDANLDGQIDAGDYGRIDNFVQIAGASGYANGDFNYDGLIDAGDYGIIDNNIQAQGAPLSTGSAPLPAVTAVPEPASLAMVMSAALLMLRRRRHGG